MYAPIPMVPGPVTIPACVREALAQDYPSGQINHDFLALMASTERGLQRLMHTKNRVLIMTGEGMLVLWGALKSVLAPKDRVFVVDNGVFSGGIAEMAKTIGAEVETYRLPYNAGLTLDALSEIAEALQRFRPHMLCAVHCETPSGTLNPLADLGALKEDLGIPLFYVDMVSSLGGAPVDVDGWHIDLALGGSQKCLSLPPSLAFSAVSERAFSRMEEIGYAGYDSFLPFRSIYTDGRCPYTPNWHGVAALSASLNALFSEGIAEVQARHQASQKCCLAGLTTLGISLFADLDFVSPTVTAALVPDGWLWPDWQQALSERGLIVAGSFGPMAGQVFRLGHMGEQARVHLVQAALDVIEVVIRRRGIYTV